MRKFFICFAFCCAAAINATLAIAQNKVKVTGTVTSAEDGLPVIGAAVMTGPENGTITSIDGEYEIFAEPGSYLIFSSIGFMDQKIMVPASSTYVCNVELKTESVKLEDAVVIAYGVRKKGTVAGSVSTVKADKLEDTPTPAFDQALQDSQSFLPPENQVLQPR